MRMGSIPEFCYALCENCSVFAVVCLWQQQSRQFVQIQVVTTVSFSLSKPVPFIPFLRNFPNMYTYVSFKEVGRGVRGLVYFVRQKHFCNHQAVEFTNLNGLSLGRL